MGIDKRDSLPDRSASEDESMYSEQETNKQELVDLPSDPQFSTPGLKGQ